MSSITQHATDYTADALSSPPSKVRGQTLTLLGCACSRTLQPAFIRALHAAKRLFICSRKKELLLCSVSCLYWGNVACLWLPSVTQVQRGVVLLCAWNWHRHAHTAHSSDRDCGSWLERPHCATSLTFHSIWQNCLKTCWLSQVSSYLQFTALLPTSGTSRDNNLPLPEIMPYLRQVGSIQHGLTFISFVQKYWQLVDESLLNLTSQASF